MRLPNSSLARVDLEKIENYLLNASHPDNGGKAGFFSKLGFGRSDGSKLVAAFLILAKVSDIIKKVETIHGCKYVLEGRIESPLGETAMVRTVWIIDRDEIIPRLVSAYPAREK